MTKIKGFSGTRKLTFPNRFQPRVCTHHVSHQQTHFHLPSAFAKLIAHARPLAPDFAADLRRASFLLCLRTWPGRRTRPISAQEQHSQRNHPALYRQRKRMEATTRAIHLSAISSIPGDGRRPGGWRISASRADISYAQGKRVKTVVLAPQPSVVSSPEDVEDIETRASFTISSDELPQYNLLYMGQQKLDELYCYVFDIAPKQMVKGKRYFQGRLWVDDQDFQIVKNKGKSVPDIRVVKKKKRVEENLFPQFTTWREQIGTLWFPTFSSADDTLAFRTADKASTQVYGLQKEVSAAIISQLSASSDRLSAINFRYSLSTICHPFCGISRGVVLLLAHAEDAKTTIVKLIAECRQLKGDS